MKILMISPHVPAQITPQAGERLVFELVKALAENHEIHLVVRGPSDEVSTLGDVRSYCKAVYPVPYHRPARRNFLTIPGVVLSYYRLCKRAEEIAATGHFDRVHVEWTETGLFLHKRRGTIIEAHDVLTKPMERRFQNAKGARRYLWYLLFRLTRIAELYVYAKFDTALVLSEYDRRYLQSMATALNIAVLQYPHSINLSNRPFQREEKTLLFLAAMDRGPNVEAALYFWNEILPLIRKKVPDVKFRIVGSRPLPEVLALAEKDENTIVTGFVEDIEPSYKTSTIFVAPLLTGGGIIVKILDALASGTAVVATSIGNEGIGATPGEHLLIADTPEDFAGNVVRLLHDKTMRERIGEAGREFVAVKYSKEALRKQVGEIYPR